MSGIGPLEPGEDTWDASPARRPPARTRGPLGRRRRAALALTGVLALAGSGAYLYAIRPDPEPPAPPPHPSQVFSVRYGAPVRPAGPAADFAFTVTLRTTAGPPVTVHRIGQPSAALSVTTAPASPITVVKGEVREVVVLIRVRDCVHVARNAGLPFLEVTLSNGGPNEQHSYILGDRYARELSRSLIGTCPEDRDKGTPETS
ncbi:Tat pathway signal sequence domain protein [Streptomyces sp. NPDC101118]|uniref:Tat pathway signal sequence domain protein n=1 Tax=Streptomyces sp. NPDC101118 TaxID=3366109 RepID=UPI003816EC09